MHARIVCQDPLVKAGGMLCQLGWCYQVGGAGLEWSGV